MAFLILAFPEIAINDFEWIQSYRKENDKLYYDVVDPHFTIVFVTNDFTETIFVDEISTLSKGLKEIEFEITDAIVIKDFFSEYYQEFLVPGKGYSEIVKLHDQLYSQRLLPNLRTDIEYIPHIGIGNSKDIDVCNNGVNNLKLPRIKGSINELAVVNYENKVISKIAAIPLY